jgi:hypothetical protein
MAYKWSWAFGPETSTELNDLAGWDIVNTAQFQPSQATIHTYTGDAADRWAMQMDYASSGMLAPLGVGGGSGWVGFYFYFNDPANDFETRNLVEIIGPDLLSRTIDIRGTAGNGFGIYMEGNLVASAASIGLAKDTWHHVAVKYQTIAGTWGAELFVNGVSVASGSRSSGNLLEQTVTHLRFNGLEDAGFYTMLSDIVTYDDINDPNPYGQLVTRAKTYFDQQDSGSWTPGSDSITEPGPQASNLSGSISTTPVVSEADPLTGEFVRISTEILGTTLGLSSFNSYGMTMHLYASGSSSTNIVPGIKTGSPNPPYTEGEAVVDGENSYAWASTASTSLASGSSIFLNAEISGS